MMSKVQNVLKRFLLIPLLLITYSSACNKPPPVSLPPEEIVSNSVQRMQEISGLHFVIDRTGAPAFFDLANLLAFRRAEGDFVAPDKAQATIRIIGPGLVAEVQIISIGEIQWETNVFSGKWQELPPNWGFNPAALFDADIGIQPILEKDLMDLEFIGSEELLEIPGLMLYSLKARVNGERLYQLSFEMIGPEIMEVQLWIAPETFDLYRMKIIDPQPGEAQPTVWQLDFWNFNQTLEITPPVLDSDGS